MHEKLIMAVLLLSLSLPGVALAQNEGSVSGILADSDGNPLPGVEVRISGPPIPAGRTAVTDSAGRFRFPLLPPGTYVLEAALEDEGRVSRGVVVRVDQDTRAALTLLPAVEEAVTVIAETPVVDVRSTEVNFNYDEQLIEALPLERSYTGLWQLIPGVANNQAQASDTGGNLGPAAGGSRQDNTFLVDGVNVTNPGFGYLSTEINELDIAQFNVKRGAISAEFGRSSGLVTNAVTKSGTNRLAGTLRFEAIPSSFIAESEDPDIRNTTDRWIPAFSVGGPIVRDHVFGYGSGRFYRSTTSDRSNNFGEIPDAETSIDEVFGKISVSPSRQHYITVGYRHRPSSTDFAGIGANDSPEVATDQEGTNRIATVTWNWIPSDDTYVDARYMRLDEENEAVAVTDLGFRPAFDPDNLATMGEFFDPALNATVGGNSLALNRQNYRRDEAKVSLSHYMDVGSTTHDLKAGVGFEDTEEDLTRRSNGWGSIALVQDDTQIRARYYPEQPSQLSLSRTYSLFVQDAISIGDRAVVNLGVLMNRDEFTQEIDTENTFLTFGFLDEVQPRIGVNYVLRPDVGDKVYANYGRYFNLDQKSAARSMAPGRLFTSDAIFDLEGNLLSDTPGANTRAKNIDPDVEAPYIDEWLVGYATPLGQDWSVDVFFTYRDADRFIEDHPQVLPASDFIYSNVPAADRKYRSLTVEVSRRLRDDWSMTASYAWSRFSGNFDLDYNNAGDSTRQGGVFNTSSALEDGPGLFVTDEFREGPLSQDRTHVFKLFSTWQPVEQLQLGGYVRVQSGTPWAAKGRDWYNGYRRYLEPAGSRRNDTWTNVDLLTSYRVPVGGRVSLTLEARVLNLLDTQTALFRDQRRYLDGRIRSFDEPPFLVQGTELPNPEFGDPTEFAPPRRLLLTALLQF